MGEFLEFVRVLLEAVDRAVDLSKPGWRVLSLIVSPVVALVAFYFNVRGRAELKEQAKDLGVLQERVNASQEGLAVKEKLLEAKDSEVRVQAAEINKLQRDIALLTERSHELWKIRPAAPFAELNAWRRDPRSARAVAFGNLKGGVGKTTLAANFGAYVIQDFMRAIQDELDLDLQLAGIIGTMSLRNELTSAEQRIWDGLESAGHSWRNDTDFRIPHTIRRAPAVSRAAGEDLAYLAGGQDGATARELFQPVFEELAKRIGIVSR